MTVTIPTLTERLGTTGLVSVSVAIVAAVGVAALWRMGKLKRSKLSASNDSEDD